MKVIRFSNDGVLYHIKDDELVKNILYNHIKIKGVRTIFQLTNHIQNIDSPLKKVER